MPLEGEAEAAAQAELLEKWKVSRANQKAAANENIQKISEGEHMEVDERGDKRNQNRVTSSDELKRSFVAHVVAPSQKEVEAALLARKKQKLLEKYVSEDLANEEFHVKTMLGIEKNVV